MVDGQKHDGIDSMIRALRDAGASLSDPLAKAHGKLVVASGGDLSGWAAEPLTTPDGFTIPVGAFSAEGPDPASVLLASLLPAGLSGRVADLGAGWGYLARAVLAHEAVSECHLVEAEYDALEAARLNLPDPRARFHWADATAFATEAALDHVVSNPPFHVSRQADPELGRRFIAAAARLLRPRGTFWMVANRHLPYEAELRKHFASVTELAGDPAFKVFRAEHPRSRPGSA